MTRASACTITRFSARSFPSAERRTNERHSGLAREHRSFLRRRSWIRALLLSAGDARAGGVFVALLAVARYPDVERLGGPGQGRVGGRAAGACVLSRLGA